MKTYKVRLKRYSAWNEDTGRKIPETKGFFETLSVKADSALKAIDKAIDCYIDSLNVKDVWLSSSCNNDNNVVIKWKTKQGDVLSQTIEVEVERDM